jgi:hypothetical protein
VAQLLSARIVRRILPVMPVDTVQHVIDGASVKYFIDQILHCIGQSSLHHVDTEPDVSAESLLLVSSELVGLLRFLASSYTLAASDTSTLSPLNSIAERATNTVDWLPVIVDRIRVHLDALHPHSSACIDSKSVACILGSLEFLGGM